MLTKKTVSFNNPYILLLILLLLWGPYASACKLASNNEDSFQTMFYVFGLASIIMTIALIAGGKMRLLAVLTFRDYLKLTLYAIPSFLYYFLFLLSLRYVPVVEATMLNYLYPVMVVVFAIPINREKLGMTKVISLLLGVAGMAVIVSNGDFHLIKATNLRGDLMAICAAACWGIFSNLGKRNLIDPFISNYIFILSSFALSAISVPIFSSFIVPDASSWVVLVWICLSGVVLAYYLWFRALKVASSALIGSLSLITPFASLMFISFLLHEKITMIQIIGLIVVLCGVAAQELIPIAKVPQASIQS